MNSITTRAWIAGASGRLGSALSHRFGGNTAYKLVTSDRDVAVEDVSVVGRFADINHPDVIINCAGLTDVQACEENPEEAYKINAIGARNLATAARRIDAKFIQISTDDVFGGDEDKAFCEFDDPHPTTMYGKSKYAGEKLVRELTDKHVIVRSSWLYGVGSYDFVDRVLDTAAKEGAVHLPEDEISSPTSAEALAGFIDCLMHSREYGIVRRLVLPRRVRPRNSASRRQGKRAGHLGLREHCAAPALYAAGQYDAAHHWFVSNAGLA